MGHFLIFSKRRGLPIAVAAILLVVLALVDWRLKSSPVLGLRPADAEWTISSADFAAFADRLTDTAAYRRSRAALVMPPVNAALALRKETGIRPTPSRWSFWLGSSFVAARSDDGWGTCHRPGLFLRIASAVAGTYHADRVYRLGERYYAWHDGFLLVSRSSEFIESAKQGKSVARPTDERPARGDSPSLTIEWASGVLTVFAEENWPVIGHVDATFSAAPQALSLSDSWIDPPLLSVSAVDPSDGLEFVLSLIEDVPLTEQFRLAVEGFRREFPEGWATDGNEYSFALVGVDTTEPLAIPELVMVLRGDDATVLPERPTDAYAYEWSVDTGDIVHGWIRPWAGEKLSIAVATDRDFRYLASQEPLMGAYLRGAVPGEPVSADLVLRIDWRQVSAALLPMLRNAAEFELLPRWNAADADERLLPYVEALAELGSAQVVGHAQDGSLRIDGHLGWTEQ